MRRGEAGGGLLIAVLIIGGIIYACSNTPEGKNAVKQTAAAIQPPVQITLRPFLIYNGYYVNVINTSSSTTLTGVTVTYTGASGNTRIQALGTLRPGESRTLDPSDAGWTVEKHETIKVSANGVYIAKVLETNVLINK